MATPLRELFVQFAAEFDFEGYEEANQKTNALRDNLKKTGDRAGRTGKQSVGLRQHMQALEGVMSGAGLQTGLLSRGIAAMVNPITLALAAVVAIVAGFVAWIAALRSIITRIWTFTSQMAELGGQIANVAARIGVATSRLEAWRQAAREANVEATAFDQALTDLAEKMGEAIQNRGSENARTFRRLGIELRDANGEARNVGDVMLDLADRLQSTHSQAERVRIANQLMGESGRQLVPVLANGRDGLEDYITQLRESQPEFDEFIKNSVELGTEQAKLNQAWEGAKQILFNFLAPAVIWVVMQLRELVIWLNNNKAVVDFLKAAAIGLAAAFAFLGAVLTVLAGAILLNLLLAFSPILIVMGLIFIAVTALTLAIQDFYVWLEGGDSVFGRFVDAMLDMYFSTNTWLRSLFDANSVMGMFLDGLNAIVVGLAEAYNAFAEFAGLDTIDTDINIRRSVQDAVSMDEDTAAALNTPAGRELIQRNMRRSIREDIGLPGTTQLERQQRLDAQVAEFAQRRLDRLELPTATRGGRPLNPALAGAVEQIRQAQTQVTQQNTNTFNISEATDAELVRRSIQEALVSQNRDLQDMLGTNM